MPLYTRRIRRFPTNQVLVPDNTLPMSSGSITESAFPTFDLPDPNDPANTLSYSFLFWSLTEELVSAQTYTTSVPSGDFTHTAWYVLTGGGGGGTPHVSTWAFSHDQGIIIPDNPIDSVTPASAWGGGSTVDTTSGAVTIDAKNKINSEDFKQWTIFGNATASGDDVSAAKDASAWAIAEYLVKVGPPVDPRIFEIREILVRTLEDLIDLKSDPAPIDLMRGARAAARCRGSPQQGAGRPRDRDSRACRHNGSG